MKSFLAIIFVIFAAFFVVNNFAPSFPAIETSSVIAAAPFRYAALLTQTPETKIGLPIRQLKKSNIADTFGAPRSNDRQHQGQDIFAKRGTPVYAAANGFVYRIGENNLGGKTVWTIGAGGRVYYYAHLEKYAENLQIGDAVSTATIIGYVGTSGNAKGTPPHLHFGVYTNRGAVDPLELFE